MISNTDQYLNTTPSPENILRYGEYIVDDVIEFPEEGIFTYERIRLVNYYGDLWYHKMIDGEAVECRKVGRV